MDTLEHVVQQLTKQRDAAKMEFERLDGALTALGGKSYNHNKGTRVMSKDARRRIAEAQRARWAVFHAKQQPKQREKKRIGGRVGGTTGWERFKTPAARSREMRRRLGLH